MQLWNAQPNNEAPCRYRDRLLTLEDAGSVTTTHGAEGGELGTQGPVSPSVILESACPMLKRGVFFLPPATLEVGSLTVFWNMTATKQFCLYRFNGVGKRRITLTAAVVARSAFTLVELLVVIAKQLL